jgi:hypothetical protein
MRREGRILIEHMPVGMMVRRHDTWNTTLSIVNLHSFKPSNHRTLLSYRIWMRETKMWTGIKELTVGAQCKGTSVHLLTLPPLLSPIPSCPLNPYSTLCICTHHHQGSTTSISNSRWLCILQVVDCWLLPLLAPLPPQTSIRYMGTCPRDTTAPSVSRGLRIRRGLEAWCCIGHYINVLRPNQGSSEHSLWISPD